MQKEKWFSMVRVFALGIALTSLLLAAGCTSDVEEEDREQYLLEVERDSLRRVVAERDRSLMELEAAREDLDREVETLTDRTASLSATAARHIQHIRIVNEEKTEATEALELEAEQRAALEAEISRLVAQIESLNEEVSYLKGERMNLESQTAAEAHRRRADSLAIVNLETTLETMTAEVWRPHYINITELTAGFGLADTEPDYTRSVIGVTHVFGYAFTERFSGGAGTGIYFYNGGSMVPLYLDFRYRFLGMNYKPFIAADGGLLFNLSDLGLSGPFINPTIGIEMKLNQRSTLHLSTGPLMQQAQGAYRASFMVVKGGLSF